MSEMSVAEEAEIGLAIIRIGQLRASFFEELRIMAIVLNEATLAMRELAESLEVSDE